MTYEKQNFKNGAVLTAEQLNKIEEGICDIEKKLDGLGVDEEAVKGVVESYGYQTEEEVNKIIAEHLAPKLAIPYNKGAYVETVYFNTSLSKEEVHNILDKLDWDIYSGRYVVCEAENGVDGRLFYIIIYKWSSE